MKKTLIILLLICNALLGYSQTKVADNFFKGYDYSKATELYLEAVKNGDSSEHVLTRIGDCYYNNSDIKSASLWYGKALKKYPEKINPEYIYKYVQTQRSLSKYQEAKKWIEVFRDRKANDRRLKDEDQFDIQKFEKLKSTEKVYVTLENLNLNTPYSEFGAFVKDNTLYFSSTRTKDTITDEKKLYQWNKEPFLSIYQSKIDDTGQKNILQEAESISSNELNTDYHEGSLVISNDGKTLYFTRTNLSKRSKLKYDKEGTSNVKIFSAKKQGDEWVDISPLPFNHKTYSTGSPALSPDGKTLFFSSDRPGGYGQTDIYKVAIKADGTFGDPENLGTEINTEGRENFPFVAKDSTLYFSSDAHLNLGLYDIFKSNILKSYIKDVEIQNLGAPYNSGYDDFAFYVDTETQAGYLSSNRPNGKGGDDIYSFVSNKCNQTISGTTKNKKTSEPLAKVTVKLVDENGKIIERVSSDDNGEYEFINVECDKKYKVIGEKAVFKSDLKDVTSSIINGDKINVDLFLTPLIIDNEIVINPIFFDYNKSTIRSDAAYELENIVAVMRVHTNMVIKIEAHTDSRGKKSYNEKLSDRRAKSTRDYLFSRGISKDRIQSAIGYGENQLINRCKDRVKCSEAEHQENRRSKFIIISGYTPNSK